MEHIFKLFFTWNHPLSVVCIVEMLISFHKQNKLSKTRIRIVDQYTSTSVPFKLNYRANTYVSLRLRYQHCSHADKISNKIPFRFINVLNQFNEIIATVPFSSSILMLWWGRAKINKQLIARYRIAENYIYCDLLSFMFGIVCLSYLCWWIDSQLVTCLIKWSNMQIQKIYGQFFCANFECMY